MLPTASALDAAAATVEQLMSDEIVIERPAAGGRAAGSLDMATGVVTVSIDTVADSTTKGDADRPLSGLSAAGMRAFIRERSIQGNSDDRLATVDRDLVISVPRDAPEIRPGDSVRVVASRYPELVGVELYVDTVRDQTLRTRRVLRCTTSSRRSV